MIKYSILYLIFLIEVSSCIVAPKYSDIPEIKFEGINKNIIDQGRVKDDSLMIRLSFTDGDGDIGDGQNKANIFIPESCQFFS